MSERSFCPLIKDTCVGTQCVCCDETEMETESRFIYSPFCTYFKCRAVGKPYVLNKDEIRDDE